MGLILFIGFSAFCIILAIFMLIKRVFKLAVLMFFLAAAAICCHMIFYFQI